MKTKIFLLITLIFAGTVSFASGIKDEKLKQLSRISVIALDTLNGYDSEYKMPDEQVNAIIVDQIDSLLNSWYIQNAYILDIDTTKFGSQEIVSIPDSVYIQRLQSIESYIDLSFNKTVKNYIELYTQQRQELTEVMLGLSNYYFPMIEEILYKYDLPLELKYMPIIESALNPTARSRANAVGLWQFVYATGKSYGLKQSTFVDDRRDPVKATEAAAQYLSDLYKIYKNWHLVIAAYNCGPGNVNKAIRRSGGARDYWTIYYRLPRETRGYVPAYIAAAYVMNNYQYHNIKPIAPDFPIVTDTMHINQYLHLEQVSNILDIPVSELESLNPQYRLDIIPATKENTQILKIPVDAVSDFIDSEYEIFAYNRDEYFPNNEILEPKSGNYTTTDIAGKAKLIYTVKSGDNLGYIAEWYHVRASDLRYWNNTSNLIRVGQKLSIFVPEGQVDHFSVINDMGFTEKQAYAKQTPVTKAVSSSQVTTDSNYVYYTVKRGDSLWSIARQFPGVSNQDIVRLNNMSSNTIQPGQKLKIQPRT